MAYLHIPMSAERRSADCPLTWTNKSRPEPTARGVETPLTHAITPETDQTPLYRRIERERHRTRVHALERQVAAHERERQVIIDHYEHILEERDRERTGDGSPRTDGRQPDGLSGRFRRLLDALRR